MIIAGAVVVPSVKISDNLIIGASGMVIQNITIPRTYVGIPVKRIK